MIHIRKTYPHPLSIRVRTSDHFLMELTFDETLFILCLMYIFLNIDMATGIRVKLQIWDTAGQERFRSITQSYYRSAHSLILVYDISSQPSFDSLPQWCRDIDQYAGVGAVNSTSGSSNRSLLKVLVGNKCDKEREVPRSIAASFADNHSFDLFMETSALEADNVEKLFQEIASVLVERSQSLSNSGNIHTNNLHGNKLGSGGSSQEKTSCMSCQFG